MLTGRFAFEFDSVNEWPILIKGAEPPSPSRFRPELAKQFPELDAFVLRMTARDRDNRFGSSSEALLAILALGAAAVKQSRPEGARATVKIVPDPVAPPPPSSRRTVLTLALGAVPIFAGGGYWLGTSKSFEPQPKEDQAAAEKIAEAAVAGFTPRATPTAHAKNSKSSAPGFPMPRTHLSA